jgi:CRP/FNR family transcriptional regulator, anaerobic regulatory protein
MTSQTRRREPALISVLHENGAPSLRAVPFEPSGTRQVVQLLSKRHQVQLAGISTRLRLPARMVVYREESTAHWVFIVAHGVIKSFRDLPSGKRRVMAFLFPDDIFGLAESGHYVNTAQAVTPVTLYRIEMPTLTAMLRRDSELQFQFLCKVTDVLRSSFRKQIIVGRRDAAGRVAMFLRMLEQETSHKGEDSEIDIPMSRSDIANYLGLSLEAVSRACRALEQKGIVDFVGRHSARILNRPRFDKLTAAL